MNSSSKIIPRTLRGDHSLCAACGRYFNSTLAFDRHRAGRHGIDRRCRTELEMRRAGMSRNAGGWWITRARPRLRSSPDSRSGDRHWTLAAAWGRP